MNCWPSIWNKRFGRQLALLLMELVESRGGSEMHLSMHNWMRAEPIEVTVARLAKYGYESIDERNLVAKDQAQREQSVQYVKDCVTMVKELDGYEMTIVPATVGKIVPDGTPEEEWEWAVGSMREIYGHALKEGVKLAVEPINRFETYFCSRSTQAIALAKATGPECGVCLDAAIRSAKDLLVDFHVADTNRFACGQGHWDWLKVVGTLQTIGYDGALTVEFVAPIDRTPANPYPDAIETNPVDISPEQKKFIEEHGSSLLTEEFYSWQVKTCADTLLPLIS
jgi:sugar phosphate isomerase/epimerase